MRERGGGLDRCRGRDLEDPSQDRKRNLPN